MLLLLYVLVFWPPGMWDPSSPARDQTLTSVGLSPLCGSVSPRVADNHLLAHFLSLVCAQESEKEKPKRRRGSSGALFFLRTLNLLDRDLPTPMTSCDVNYFLTSNTATLGA